uniref:Succinate dehydrogenase [ubiquinone] cytochrome b small subunit n=1 Tax=Rhabditophanes sp. KR3021 TaxID=114890 RepID=A0AC35TY55_9BILA
MSLISRFSFAGSRALKMSPVFCSMRSATTAASGKLPQFQALSNEPLPVNNHPAKEFMIEKYLTVAFMPFIPAAYYIHSPAMDFILALGCSAHVYLGWHMVATDYARPFLYGNAAAKAMRLTPVLFAVICLAGLLHFNYNDVGLTKAFEMVFAL